LFWEDATTSYPGEIPNEVIITGTSYAILGLNPGDTYDLAFASINANGVGPWGGAPQAIVGRGAPSAPTISAASSSQLTWAAVPGATGYWIYQANPNSPGQPITWTRLQLEVPQGWNGTLVPGVYSVTAANGTVESPKSNAVTLPPRPARPRASSGSAPARSTRAPGSRRGSAPRLT